MISVGSLRVRRPAAADAARVAALMTAAERADGVTEETVEADVRDHWRRLDLSRDAWLVETENGELAGYADADTIAAGRYRADGYVEPTLRGLGIGALLVQLTEARARELAGAAEQDVQLFNALAASNDAGRRLLEARGYDLARRYQRMAIELAVAPDPPVLPPTVVARAIDAERDGPAVHAALEEIFADHWDPVSVPYDQWRSSHLGGEGFDPGLWIVAEDGGEVAGVAACRRRHGGGFVDELGVRRPWRGLGLGLGLLRLAFGEFWKRGERRVALSVDSDSLTGATRLYERAGMWVEFELAVYRKSLA